MTKSEQAVERALQCLTADQRDALFLHLGKGMTCLEIAQQTGVPREAVLNDLVRAYARIRACNRVAHIKSRGVRDPPTSEVHSVGIPEC